MSSKLKASKAEEVVNNKKDNIIRRNKNHKTLK